MGPEGLGLGRGGKPGPLRLRLKMAAARSGRHFLGGALSPSAAQNGGRGRRPPGLRRGSGGEPGSGVGDLSRVPAAGGSGAGR